MWDRGLKMLTQVPSGVSRCFCGAEITVGTVDGHVRAEHLKSGTNQHAPA